MRRLPTLVALLVALLVTGCAANSKERPKSVAKPDGPAVAAASPTYRVTIDVSVAEQMARVTATLSSLPEEQRGRTIDFAFARRFAFVTLAPTFAEPPTATSKGEDSLIDRSDPFHLRVESPDSGEVELRYAIRLDQRAHPEVVAGTDQYEHSFVTDAYGMLFTAELVPAPDVALDVVEVRLTGDHASSAITPWLEAKGSSPDGRAWAPRRSELGDDIVLLGEGWQTVDARAHGLRATFALNPDATWLAPLAEEIFVPIVEAEVDLFERAPRECYLFVFGPADGVRGYGGSPKTGSMTLFVADDLPESQAREGLAHLIAHEFHHTFGRTGRRASDDLRFVTEGYTDYYAYIVPWRLGMIDDATLHVRLERKLTEGAKALADYQQSLALAGGPDFFAGREAYQACYAAGLSLALWTDLALRQADAGTLDDLLRDWYALDPTAEPEAERGLAGWEKALAKRLSAAEVLAYMEVVETVEDVHWEELFDRVNLVVEQVDDSIQLSPSVIDRLR